MAAMVPSPRTGAVAGRAGAAAGRAGAVAAGRCGAGGAAGRWATADPGSQIGSRQSPRPDSGWETLGRDEVSPVVQKSDRTDPFPSGTVVKAAPAGKVLTDWRDTHAESLPGVSFPRQRKTGRFLRAALETLAVSTLIALVGFLILHRFPSSIQEVDWLPAKCVKADEAEVVLAQGKKLYNRIDVVQPDGTRDFIGVTIFHFIHAN